MAAESKVSTLYPLKFHPLFKERIWGGRILEMLYGKRLPPGVPVGESWEISDRPGDVSVIANGPLAGTDLHSLFQSHRMELLGPDRPNADRFPLLIKILDAREKLSLQVHPPARKAAELGGEPKTEMWYVVHAEPEAELYVGLRRGVSQRDFESQLRAGAVDQCFHRVQVRAGDTMFLPSGRVHAIGAGLVIFEIQQNSDTTYRVFDWNRLDRDGKPRQLHIPESLESIDFDDIEPGLVVPRPLAGTPHCRRLVSDPLFSVDLLDLPPGSRANLEQGRMQILGVAEGQIKIMGGGDPVGVSAGEFCLLPAGLGNLLLESASASKVLRVQVGQLEPKAVCDL